LLVAGIVGSIVGAKVLRRRRRRSAARVSARFVGGWRELVDHARDLGVPVPGGAVTRREQALAFAGQGAPALARTADRHAMSREVGRRRRVLAALSLRTFRRA
jgi:hypothetical protein